MILVALSPVLKTYQGKVTQASDYDILNPFLFINPYDKNDLDSPIVPADVVLYVET